MRDDANPSTEGDVSSEIDITHQTRTSRVEEGIGANDTSEGFNMDTHNNTGSIPRIGHEERTIDGIQLPRLSASQT